MEKEKTTLPSHDQVNGAMTGLRGWLSAGKSHADRGGSLISLDSYVETALAEVEWRLDAEAADEDETERPSDEELSVALAGMRGLKEDGPLADDVAILLEWLDGTDVEGREKRSRSTLIDTKCQNQPRRRKFTIGTSAHEWIYTPRVLHHQAVLICAFAHLRSAMDSWTATIVSSMSSSVCDRERNIGWPGCR